MGPYGVFLHDGSEYSGSYVDSMTPKVSEFILFISLEINLCFLIISFSKSYIHNYFFLKVTKEISGATVPKFQAYAIIF